MVNHSNLQNTTLMLTSLVYAVPVELILLVVPASVGPMLKLMLMMSKHLNAADLSWPHWGNLTQKCVHQIVLLGNNSIMIHLLKVSYLMPWSWIVNYFSYKSIDILNWRIYKGRLIYHLPTYSFAKTRPPYHSRVKLQFIYSRTFIQ